MTIVAPQTSGNSDEGKNMLNNSDAKNIETKKTFVSNEESDEEENEVVEKYSKILMNHSKDETDLAVDENLLMDTVRPRAKAETEGQMSENNKNIAEKQGEITDIVKKKSEASEKNENFLKLKSQNDKNVKIDKNDNFETKNNNNPTNPENNVPKRFSSKKERNEAALKEKQEMKTIVRNKFYNMANNSKVWKTFFGNFAITNKNEITSKDNSRKIIDEHDFDYLNFYETEVQTFGGNM